MYANFVRCANIKCHNTSRCGYYCSYCNCLVFGCHNIVGEYSYCQQHKCTDPTCHYSIDRCKGQHSYHSKYLGHGKCLICPKVRCEETPYCNEHGCLRFTEDGKRHGYTNYKYCKNAPKIMNGKIFERCNDCLIYCKEPLCTSEHEYGTNYCRKHDYIYYHRTIESKNYFRCGSSLCKKCPVVHDFIYLYFMVALSCDARVPYVIYNNINSHVNK
jgi:hypothetical protein